MYSRGANPDEATLTGRGDLPDLEVSARFQQVIETLPHGACVPMSVIKLGFLTGQLRVGESGYEVTFSAEDIESQPQAQVPPQTLAAVRWLLAELVDELPDRRKQVVGAYCDAAELNRRPEQGTSAETVRKVAPTTYAGMPDFLTEAGGEHAVGRSSEASSRSTSSSESGTSGSETRARETTEDDPFAAGKEITTKGGERITGKNPFADPDRLKDTGLHQGGG